MSNNTRSALPRSESTNKYQQRWSKKKREQLSRSIFALVPPYMTLARVWGNNTWRPIHCQLAHMTTLDSSPSCSTSSRPNLNPGRLTRRQNDDAAKKCHQFQSSTNFSIFVTLIQSPKTSVFLGVPPATILNMTSILLCIRCSCALVMADTEQEQLGLVIDLPNRLPMPPHNSFVSPPPTRRLGRKLYLIFRF